MIYVLKGRLKNVVEKAIGKKTLKRVVESTIKKKNRAVAGAERRATTVEADRDSYQHKLSVLEGQLEDSDSQLAQALSVI